MTGRDGMIMQVDDINWEKRLAARTRRMQSSVIRELLKLTALLQLQHGELGSRFLSRVWDHFVDDADRGIDDGPPRGADVDHL